MDIEAPRSKVYVLLDERSRIVRCEGGYTMSNIDDVSKWVYIDEGTGDRYNLCQSHYLDDGLYTYDGISRYKYEDGACVLRSEEEMEADRAALPPPAPTQLDRVEAQLAYTAMMTDTLMEV